MDIQAEMGRTCGIFRKKPSDRYSPVIPIIVISASTAAGKTEAAFLPAITAIADETSGFGILYISPLKALINDQYPPPGRTVRHDEHIKVTSWAPETVSQSKKERMPKRNPEGILLITPESLESLLIREARMGKGFGLSL